MDVNTSVYRVEGMKCAHCAARVEKAIKNTGAEAIVNLAEKTVTVTGGTDAVVLRAVEDAGYKAEKI